MRAPDRNRGSSIRNTITEVLTRHGFTCPFLLRLRDDPDRCIDQIWKKVVENHPLKKFLEQDSHSMDIVRELFVMELMNMWDCVFIANTVAMAKARTQTATRDKKAKIKKTLVRSLSKMSAEELLAFLQDASTDLQRSVELEEHDKAIRQNRLHPVLNIRSNRAGSRSRTVFMRMGSRLMHRTTGEWHDDWVINLTNVAFPDHETTIDMVRSARRGIRP